MGQLETNYKNNFKQDFKDRNAVDHRAYESLKVTRWTMNREDQNDGFLQFWVNPSECTWQQGLRSAFAKTMGGIVHHEIDEINVSRLDLPVLSISFQAGLITPGEAPHLTQGLANFYDFLDLVDRPNIQNGEDSPNYVNIFYVSPTFSRKGIWLQGFFDESGVSWSDTSATSQTITGWTANFMVFKSNPPLNELRRSFRGQWAERNYQNDQDRNTGRQISNSSV